MTTHLMINSSEVACGAPFAEWDMGTAKVDAYRVDCVLCLRTFSRSGGAGPAPRRRGETRDQYRERVMAEPECALVGPGVFSDGSVVL